MIREIVLDTETTGISPADGHRVVEVGAVELLNHVPSGKAFHAYLNPERDMPPEAQAVHGLSLAFLKDKPLFATVVDEFLDFIAGDVLVIHNASFDVGFLNAELAYTQRSAIEYGRVIDTLQMARRKHPMASNSLDALCKRYGIDTSKRTKHGALLDAELLAEVYVELLGGRQTAMDLAASNLAKPEAMIQRQANIPRATRQLPPRLTEAERLAHEAFVKDLGPGVLWNN